MWTTYKKVNWYKDTTCYGLSYGEKNQVDIHVFEKKHQTNMYLTGFGFDRKQ